ncbi:XrtB/PEP-CTERM-associated transcriptional regulator EpsA [Pseudorhodoferax sp.]|uniref:XrtB/PEP-CTERM-associated transcriptional regulator EpsA n=1 Tax=Pseudorhodoferax sp. TaxID=1993553 RepID=UPI002DD6A9B8|nr:XrtB/PEP-CTERM-associated transcriptional regulator EpsA [Pseudorhodoferax sp.]
MPFLSGLSNDDRDRCLKVLAEIADIRTHLDLFKWLHGGFQHFLPHDVLIAAWGNFPRGQLRYDIVSPLRGVRTSKAHGGALIQRMQELFTRWAVLKQPFATHADRLSGTFSVHPFSDPVEPMRSALVHGLRDRRDEQDSLYVVLSREAMPDSDAKEALDVLLPHIDTALRKVGMLQQPTGGTGGMQITVSGGQINGHGTVPPDIGMTERELQVMQWVQMGKTNQEIGTILEISGYTVKNHLQRIFKKLDVYNRAQAVSVFKESHHAHG